MPHFVHLLRSYAQIGICNVQRIISVQCNSLNAKKCCRWSFSIFFSSSHSNFFHLCFISIYCIICKWLCIYFICVLFHFVITIIYYLRISQYRKIYCIYLLVEFSWPEIFDMVRIEKKSLDYVRWMNLKCIET